MMLLATLGLLASIALVQSASLGGISSLSREMNYNSIPGGDNEESNLVEPAPFASLSDFLNSKQGFGKKSDDASRMKTLVKALYAFDALGKKVAEKADIDEESDVTTLAASETTTLAATTVASTTPSTTAAPTTEAEPSTDAPTLIHDSEVNEFVDQIAKHISTFFQGIMHYFDGPSLPANATVVIEIDEKSEDSSESSESAGESESEEVSTEDVPKWLVQMFESVAALPHDEINHGQDKPDYRPKEPTTSSEYQER